MSYHGDAVYNPIYDEWLPATGLPDGYYVSPSGHVMHRGQILKDRFGDRAGHLAISYIDKTAKKRKYVYVHRIVAETYLPNNSHAPIVRHLDGNPTNNHVDNLAWGTQKENYEDSVRHGTAYIPTDEDRECSYEESRTPIGARRVGDAKVLHFRGQGEASRILSIPQANIWKVLNGQRCQAGGYQFWYEEVRE